MYNTWSFLAREKEFEENAEMLWQQLRNTKFVLSEGMRQNFFPEKVLVSKRIHGISEDAEETRSIFKNRLC